MPHALSYVDIDVNSSSDVKKDKSVTDSDSNREIILFKGRGNRHKARRGSKWRGRNRPATSPKPSNASAREPIESDDDEGTNAAMDDYISNILLDEMQQTQQDQVEIPENFDNGIPGTHISEPKPGRVSPVGTDVNSDETDNEDSDGQTWGLSATMDDSQLARLLAKQEELGLGSGKLLLLDGDSIAGGDQGMIGRRDRKASAKKRSTPMDTLKKNFATVGGSYPSAEAVADAFERLNMSGWGGARDGLELNLSDSELEVQLRMSWQKDRQRKKEKKRAREELRSKGLLRKDANSNDPRVKYPDGMHMDDIKTEFFNFLNGTETRQAPSPYSD
ncbi:r3h and g-patch domain protein [Grosmannia clavigera kw1407]|uniref:R3h and g-patch domain protein n=1 Tax=Grosmannia clavigera (strain kw1407 / UAMH 11150) TaxID=655863 RepID=F0XNI5_GROCL|nr:r3h and g-patch domain protein [Grosmannia clavigera kw1407]EFX00952.1 r3h and g-patch domain protein [Grosmannia clavigera kw1407]